MQYKGSIMGKMVDHKRRFTMPTKWIDKENAEFCFVANTFEQITELRLYPLCEWEKLLHSLPSDKEKSDIAKRTTHVELKSGRLLLPKGCIWKKIDLIGVLDFIIIIESMV